MKAFASKGEKKKKKGPRTRRRQGLYLSFCFSWCCCYPSRRLRRRPRDPGPRMLNTHIPDGGDGGDGGGGGGGGDGGNDGGNGGGGGSWR